MRVLVEDPGTICRGPRYRGGCPVNCLRHVAEHGAGSLNRVAQGANVVRQWEGPTPLVLGLVNLRLQSPILPFRNCNY